jgi:hypothetical protein
MNFENMVMVDPCPIWGTAANKESLPGCDASRYISPRAGGAYEIDSTTEFAIKSLRVPEKVKLTTWLVNQRKLGNQYPREQIPK